MARLAHIDSYHTSITMNVPQLLGTFTLVCTLISDLEPMSTCDVMCRVKPFCKAPPNYVNKTPGMFLFGPEACRPVERVDIGCYVPMNLVSPTDEPKPQGQTKALVIHALLPTTSSAKTTRHPLMSHRLPGMERRIGTEAETGGGGGGGGNALQHRRWWTGALEVPSSLAPSGSLQTSSKVSRLTSDKID